MPFLQRCDSALLLNINLIDCAPSYLFSRRLLQEDVEEGELVKNEQSQKIAQGSSQIESLKTKCSILKEKVKSLIEKNKAWEDSYKAQSNDLVWHGMEISRLNGQNSELQRALLNSQSPNELSVHTPQQSRTQYPGHPGTM